MQVPLKGLSVEAWKLNGDREFSPGADITINTKTGKLTARREGGQPYVKFEMNDGSKFQCMYRLHLQEAQ